ncbi:MAG: glycosyltransferase family 2 protein [Pseudomonadota bacterium]
MPNRDRIMAVVPAKDEAPVIARVVTDLCALRDATGAAIFDRVVVCDNGSHDSTGLIAEQAGARVVVESQAGYGAACLCALSEVRDSDVVVFVDADGSVSPNDIPRLLMKIESGNELVIGVRTAARREPGAMTAPQRIGTALVCALINLLWHCDMRDVGPLRAIRLSALDTLQMHDRAYGWTVEMQVKALQHKMRIAQVDVNCRRRIGQSKISGSISGVVRAGWGMLSTIALLARRGRETRAARVYSRTDSTTPPSR